MLGWDATKSAPPIKKFDASDHRMVSVAVSPDRRNGRGRRGGRSGSDLGHGFHRAACNIRAELRRQVYCLSFSPRSTKLVAAGGGVVDAFWDVLLTKTKQK